MHRKFGINYTGGMNLVFQMDRN